MPLTQDSKNSCPSCHGIVINGIQAVGSGGGRNCAQRSESAWVATINKMVGKGCPDVTDVQGAARYLASIGATTTTTTTTKATTTTTATTAVQTTTTAPIGDTTTTGATTTITVGTTTTTTAMTGCNTYVNGTTQYKYGGSGSCHGHGDDLVTGDHVVRDQKWCQKHMTHFNSKGNHTHTYPHPQCM